MVLTPTEFITCARQIVKQLQKSPPPPQDRGGHPVDYYGIVLKHGVYEDEYRCEVCEVFLSGVVPLREHLVSHKHRKRIKPHLPERNKEVQDAMHQFEEVKHPHIDSYLQPRYPQHEQHQQRDAQFGMSQTIPPSPTPSHRSCLGSCYLTDQHLVIPLNKMVLTPTELITHARQIVMSSSKLSLHPEDRGGHPVDYYGIVLQHGVHGDEYRCEICEVALNGIMPLKQHLVSQNHAKHIKSHLPERNHEVQNAMYQLEEEENAPMGNFRQPRNPRNEQPQQQRDVQCDVSQTISNYPTPSYQTQQQRQPPTIFQLQQQQYPQQTLVSEPGYNLQLEPNFSFPDEEDVIDFRPGYQFQYHCRICNVFMPSEIHREKHILEKDHLEFLDAYRSQLHPGNLQQQHAQPSIAQMGSRHPTQLYQQEYEKQLQQSTEFQLHQQYQQPGKVPTSVPAFNAPQQQQNYSHTGGFAIPQPPQQWIQQLQHSGYAQTDYSQQKPQQQVAPPYTNGPITQPYNHQAEQQQQRPGLQSHPGAFGSPVGPPATSLLPPAAYLPTTEAISGSLFEKEPMIIQRTTELIELGDNYNATAGRGRSRGRANPRNVSPSPTVSIGRGRGRCLPSMLTD